MHMSLPRRYHHVGRSMRFLLWICFGLLAVVPWQAIRGQDRAEKPAVDQRADTKNRESDGDPADQTADDSSLNEKPKPVQSTATKNAAKGSSPSLIFRGQDAAMQTATLQMSPIQMGPEMQRGPEVEDPGFLASDRITGRTGEALGSLFRIGGFTGPAIGRRNSLFPIEYMPYSLVDNNLIFADFRGFKSTTDTWGTNLGGGYRRYIPQLDRIFGVNAFFDYDNTSGSTFRQVGFGAEWLGSLYDLRGNAYFPTGPSSQETSLVNLDGTQKFIGHLLTVNRLHTFNNALHGFDGEIGVPIPGSIPERHDVRVFGGGYWYESDLIQSFGGWKTRIQANVIPSVSLQLEVTHDQQFKTNVVFGGSWSYGGFRQSPDKPKSQYDRMTTPVIRNYNIIVGTAYKTDVDNVVTNPDTNQPYFFEHVDSNSKAPVVNGVVGDGTFEHPFQVFTNAQTAMLKDTPIPTGSNLRGTIFVHGDSVFNSAIDPLHNPTIALQDNVRVLGGSATVKHEVNTTELNSNPVYGHFLLLPQGSGNKPEFDNTPIDPNTNASITLANYSEFSGFNVKNPVGIGIYGFGITGSNEYSTVRQTDVTGAGLNSVVLDSTAGTILFSGDNITSSGLTEATTFLVQNTTANSQVIFTSDSLTSTKGTINNTDQGVHTSPTLEIRNTKAGSHVDFVNSILQQNAATGIEINDTHGNGIQIHDNFGEITIGNANLTGSVPDALRGFKAALYVFNNQGTFSSTGDLLITNAHEDSITVEKLGLNGSAQFTGTDPKKFGVDIQDRESNRGIYLYNNIGPVAFTTPVRIVSPSGVPFAAIDYQHNGTPGAIINGVQGAPIGGNASFNDITITKGGLGILIGPQSPGAANPPNYGNFIVNGTTTIDGTSDKAIEINNDSSTVTFAAGGNSSTTISNPGNIGIEVLSNNGTVSFNSTTTIRQPAFNLQGSSILPAINIQGNTNLLSSVTFDTATIIGGNQPVNLPVNSPQYGVNIGDPIDQTLFNPAGVKFTTLNISGLQNGVGLLVNHEGVAPKPTLTGQAGQPGYGLFIGGGIISTTGGRSVDIEESTIDVTLTSVFSSKSPQLSPDYGIYLLNDDKIITPNLPQLGNFMFTLGTATANSGGIIQQATRAGINLNQTDTTLIQTGAVKIQGVLLQTNQLGISANNLLQLNVDYSQFTGNIGNLKGNDSIATNGANVQTGAGIDAFNLPYVDVEHSTFTLNGTKFIDNNTADHAIYLHADAALVQQVAGVAQTNNGVATGGKYIWVINNNTTGTNFTGQLSGAPISGDVVLVEGPNTALTYTPPGTSTVIPTPLPVPLVFQFNNNTVNVQANAQSLAQSATVTDFKNAIAGVDVKWAGQIDAGSSIATVISSMSNNIVNLKGNDFGFLVQNGSTGYATSFDMRGNSVIANGGGNTGIAVNDNNQSNLNIANNIMTFSTPINNNLNVGNEFGMKISVNTPPTGTSQMIFSDNTITMTGGAGNQGIVFPVMDGPASITFDGNNINISGALPINGQGIDFAQTSPPIILHGSRNNIITITGAAPLALPGNKYTWFNPYGSNNFKGAFLINGSYGPN